MEESRHSAVRSEEEVKTDFAGAGWTLVSRDEVTWLRSANPSRGLREAEAACRLGLRAHEREGRRSGLRQDRGSAALTRRRASIRDQRAARLLALGPCDFDGSGSAHGRPGRPRTRAPERQGAATRRVAKMPMGDGHRAQICLISRLAICTASPLTACARFGQPVLVSSHLGSAMLGASELEEHGVSREAGSSGFESTSSPASSPERLD
jgi:hypothetical protein